MTLTRHEVAGSDENQYSISGLPSGEHALIAEFPVHGWRILRWNDDWHGNWTGSYPTFEAALAALHKAVSLTPA